MNEIDISAYQLQITKKEDFLKQSDELLDDFPRKGFVIFPERFLLDTIGEDEDREIFQFLKDLSQRVTLIAGSLLVRENDRIYNRSYVFHLGKTVGYQDKIVPFSRERGRITPGRTIKIFSSEKLCFAVPVCYDLDFPFFSKLSAVHGARFIFNPSLIRRDFHEEWHQYMITRALENRISLVSVNSTTDIFNGDSIYVETYEEDEGVRIRKTIMGRNKKKTFKFSLGNISDKFMQRIAEDPGVYSFPVKKIFY